MPAHHLLPILPIRAVDIDLVITKSVRLRFFHQPLVAALVRTLMDGALTDEPRLWIETPESGRVPFAGGERYGIRLWCCAGAEAVLEALVDRLRRLPSGLPMHRRELPLGGNLRFRRAFDALSGEPYRGVAHLQPYDADAFAAELDRWLDEPPAWLRLQSPARLLRPKGAGRPPKGEARFIHDRGELEGDLLGQRIDDSLAALLDAVGAVAPRRGPAAVSVTDDDIGWCDAAYYDADGQGKPLGGIIGALALRIDAPAALPALVLGQYIGIGQRRTFGWGRYRLESAERIGTRPPRRPSRGILERAAEPANIELAYRYTRAGAGGGPRPDTALDPDDDAIAELAWVEHPEPVDDLLDQVRDQLLGAAGLTTEGRAPPRDDGIEVSPHQPNPKAGVLEGRILQREGKAPRPLAVPSVAERVAQRALLQVLRLDCEPLLSAASYGYRRGISREDARDRLQALYRNGYEWLYEADIDDFFDSVSHPRLANRLHSLFPDDPAVEQIMAWMAAPVSFRGERIERDAGLPQGAPLSPLMANLLLDDFDADLEHLGFKLVRFADDFVIACRTRAEAEAAAERVQRSLAELDLSVNPDKSGITHFDRGFRFLGYSFLRDLAVDGGRRRRHIDGPLRLQDLPPASWLARLARRVPAILDDAPIQRRPGPRRERAAEPEHPEARVPIASLTSGEPCTLIIVSEGSQLSIRDGRLRVAAADGGHHEQPLASLGAILLLGRQRVTIPSLTAALNAGVPVHFASRGGRHLGVLSANRPGPAGVGLWLRQARCFQDPGQALPLARELVAARIHNQTELIRQRARGRPDLPDARRRALDEALDGLRRGARKVADAGDRAELNGLEGSAARHAFAAMAALIPDDFGFHGRQRRPPPDPVNALLSLGYTLLYQRADTVLRAAGLLAEQGFYHQGHGRHAALASDLMECLRHLIEREALTRIARGQVKPEDFTVDPDLGCRLRRPALRDYVTAVSRRFTIPMEDAATGERGTLYDHLWRLSRVLIDRIDGRAVHFKAFRIR